MNKRRPLLFIGSVLVLCLLAVIPVFAQEPIEEEWLCTQRPGLRGAAETWGCYDHDLPRCFYITDQDNRDNDWNSASDYDMGWNAMYTRAFTTCRANAKHPIEFAINVPEITYDTNAVLFLGVPLDANPMATRDVYLGGVSLELDEWFCPPEYECEYKLLYACVDPELVQEGYNRVEVRLRSNTCLEIWEGYLGMYDYEHEFCVEEEVVEEEFIPEPGTIVLFGSGLLGLAGYAGLRWRNRKA